MKLTKSALVLVLGLTACTEEECKRKITGPDGGPSPSPSPIVATPSPGATPTPRPTSSPSPSPSPSATATPTCRPESPNYVSSVALFRWTFNSALQPNVGVVEGGQLPLAYGINTDGVMRTAIMKWGWDRPWNIDRRVPTPGYLAGQRTTFQPTIQVHLVSVPDPAGGRIGISEMTRDGQNHTDGAVIRLYTPAAWARWQGVSLTGPGSAVQTNRYWHYLENVMTHELGHAMGILAHSPNSGDIMYGGETNPHEAQMFPTLADQNTLWFAYSPCR